MTTSVYQQAAAAARDQDATGDALFSAASALEEAFSTEQALPADAPTLMLHLYDRAGEGGMPSAWTAIGRIYASSAYAPAVRPDPSRSLAFFRLGAESGDRAATIAFIRATHFARIDVGEPFYTEAADRLNAMLADSADPELLVLAAWMLNGGEGYARDPERARAMLEVAAASGNPEALFEHYVYLCHGIGGAVDTERALRRLFAAAEAGHVRAMANLGGMYATGSDVPQDDAQSVAWYRRAADAGHARAAFNLSVMFATGVGAPRDEELSTHYRQRADALGYRPS